MGPRQVGKSTLCRSLGAALYVDLADEASFLGYAKDPARLRREVDALVRFVLTGSSARKLRRGGANLLPGRIIHEHVDPLSVLETPRRPAGTHSRPVPHTPRERRIARSTACWSGRAIAPSLRRIMVRLIVR